MQIVIVETYVNSSMAKCFAEMLMDENINVITSSTYIRAIETVIPLADQLNKPIIEFEELRERHIKGLNYKLTEQELLAGIERSFEDMVIHSGSKHQNPITID